MNSEQISQVLAISEKRHELPIDVILINMVDFSRIKSLPQNQDCTELLYRLSGQVLAKMFPGHKPYVETFMPRAREFERLLEQEIAEYRQSQWFSFADNDNPQSTARKKFF